MKKMSVNERQAEIIAILKGRREETMANLAQQLEVSIRTIYYDIETLSVAYPLETVRGNGGCVRLMSDFGVYKGDISEEQQTVLITQMPAMDRHSAKVIGELLRAHGSFCNKGKIEEAIKIYA